MNEEDFKRLLKEALSPIIQTLKDHSKILRHHSEVIDEQLLPSVLETEQTLKAYGDMYKLNRDELRKLEKRLQVVEDKNQIQPPAELILAEF